MALCGPPEPKQFHCGVTRGVTRQTWSDPKDHCVIFYACVAKTLVGGRTRTRTWDPLIKSQLLYQLSYAPGIAAARDRQAAA
jgi:hypothetical protein